MANNGTLFSVILHEMGHVLGIGTLWSTFGLTSGSQYIGADAVNAYHQLGGTGFVPIETGGGPGSAFVHWSEAVFDNELMTPQAALPGVAMPLSILTIGGVQDLGYKVDYAAADPYSLPGHLEAGEQRVSMLANTTWAASAFDSQGTSGFDSAFEPTLLADDGLASGGTPGSDRAYAAAPANDAVGNSASAASAALLTNYLATAFIAPAGLGAGTIAAMQMSDQDFLAKPVA